MMRVWKKTIVLLLAGALALGGCGSQPVEAPELIDYQYGGQNYRPVTTYRFGTRTTCAKVEPVEDAYFWSTDAVVKEIYVSVGQYVEAGDLLAEAAVGSVAEQISEARSRLKLLQEKADIEVQIALLNHEQMEFAMAGQSAMGDTEGAKNTAVEMAQFEEDTRYEETRRNQEIELLQKNIKELEKLQNKSRLTAEYAGYVTYAKDMSASSTAGRDENIIVVARENERMLCVNDAWVKTDLHTRTFYAEIDGEKVLLEAVEYTTEEKKALEQKDIKSNLTRFVRADGKALPANGEIVYLIGEGDNDEEVLVVGTDSLVQDSFGSFVYVKSADGENKEVRYVKIGKKDISLNLTEVTEGLSEGEEVYYFSNTPQVQSEGTVVVEESIAEYFDTNTTTHVKPKVLEIGYSEQEGIVGEIYKTEGEHVAEGDLLYTVRTDKTASGLKEYQDSINALQEDESRAETNYNKQVEELQKQIDAAKLNEAWRKQQLLDQAHAAEQTPAEGSGEEVEPSGQTSAVGENGGEVSEPDEQTIRAGEYGVTRPDYLAFVDPYGSEQLTRTLEIVKLRRQIDLLTYNYYLKLAKSNYQKAKENNNGQGVISVYAGATGTLSQLKLESGNKISENQYVYSIESDTEKVVIFNSDNGAAYGSTITFMGLNSGKIFTGKVIGTKGDDKAFLNVVEGEIEISTTPNTEGRAKVYYAEIEDESFLDCVESFSAKSVSAVGFHIISIPYNALCDETVEGNTYYYVWKVTQSGLSKVYVKPAEFSSDMAEISYTVKNPDVEFIAAGLKEGDEIALERKEDHVKYVYSIY